MESPVAPIPTGLFREEMNMARWESNSNPLGQARGDLPQNVIIVVKI
jgi:hypothetical protein